MSKYTNQNSITSQPAFIAAASACLRSDALKDWLHIVAPETIRHSILPVEQFGYEPGKGGKSARTAEFNAGRFCALQALSTWNQDGPVGKAADRSPIWPDGFTGSISHSNHWVWASVAKSKQVLSVGVDTEAIVDAATRSQTWEQVATIEELRSLEALDLDPKVEFTVLFSAKEAFYKCWYPITKQYLDFKDVIVDLCEPEQLTIRPTTENSNSEIDHLTVQYFVDAEDVYTVTWMAKKA